MTFPNPKALPPMRANTAKQEAIETINRLPDNAPLDEIIYRLYALRKAQQGVKDVDEGRGIWSKELVREIEQW